MSRIQLAAFVATLCAISACTEKSNPVPQPPAPESAPTAQRANPASENCVKEGGDLVIESAPKGQYGVCVFEDNRQCEEWALLRGECQAGGVKVTGYATAAARYCAITGGSYSVVARSGAADEQGACTLPGGKTCDADAYYAMTCTR